MLVNAPSGGLTNRQDWQRNTVPPLGTAYMASMLIGERVDFVVHDLEVEPLVPADLLAEIREKGIRLVGISCVTVSFKNACRIAGAIERACPGVVTVLGGPHVAFDPAGSLAYTGVDAVCLGEGENVIVDLAHAVEAGSDAWREVRGIAWRDPEGNVVQNAPADPISDLDALPFPALACFDLQNYRSPGILMSTRGCPFKCFFCSEANAIGEHRLRPGFRTRSAENILEEIRTGLQAFGIQNYFFADDVFTLNKRRVLKICDALASSREDDPAFRNFTFSCEARADTLDAELVESLAAAGCVGVQMGLESGSQRILDSIGKGTRLEQYREAVDQCSRQGIETALSFMFPHPGDDRETVAATKAFVQELFDLGGTSFVPALTTPYPGTQLFRSSEELGVKIIEDDWDLYNCNWPVIETRNFDVDGIRREYADIVALCQKLNLERGPAAERKQVVSGDMLQSLRNLGVDRAAVLGPKRIGQIV